MLLKAESSNSLNEFQLREHGSDLRQALQQTQGDGAWATSHFQAARLGSCTTLLQVPEYKINQSLSTQNKTTRTTITRVTIIWQSVHYLSLSSLFKPLFLVSVWTQEVSSSVLDLWSPIPQSRTAQASCTTYWFAVIIQNMHSTLGGWENENLDRRLVQSCHICWVFSVSRSCVNCPLPRLSIWVMRWHQWVGECQEVHRHENVDKNIQFWPRAGGLWCTGWSARVLSRRSGWSAPSMWPKPAVPWSCQQEKVGCCSCGLYRSFQSPENIFEKFPQWLLSVLGNQWRRWLKDSVKL